MCDTIGQPDTKRGKKMRVMIQLDIKDVAKLDTWAKREGLSRTALIRRQLRLILDKPAKS